MASFVTFEQSTSIAQIDEIETINVQILPNVDIQVYYNNISQEAAASAAASATSAEASLATITNSSNVEMSTNLIRTQTLMATYHPLY